MFFKFTKVRNGGYVTGYVTAYTKQWVTSRRLLQVLFMNNSISSSLRCSNVG